LIAAWLVSRDGGSLWWVAGYNVAVAAISLISARLLPETLHQDLDAKVSAAERSEVLTTVA